MEFGHAPLRKGLQRHARELQAFEDVGDAFLVTREPVDGFGANLVNLAACDSGQERLQAGPIDQR
ncbi:hypothetical protein D3C71_1942940 [compost metagenome]